MIRSLYCDYCQKGYLTKILLFQMSCPDCGHILEEKEFWELIE
jgi:hypothetical protein